jgi:hypothetical protein
MGKSITTTLTQNTDNRAVIGESGIQGDGNTSISNTVDSAAVPEAFKFAQASADLLQQGLTRFGQLNLDASKYSLDTGREALNQSYGLVDSVVGGARKQSESEFRQALDFSRTANTSSNSIVQKALAAVDTAYQDAKGAGQRGDKLIIGAMVLAGVVAIMALKKG